MDLCCVLPVWKHGHQVRNAIHSIRGYEPDCFFVIVDNGADPDVKSVIADVPNSEVIRNDENKLVNFAWNQGLWRAVELGASLIALANSDIILHSSLDAVRTAIKQGKFGTYVPWPGGMDGCQHLGDMEHLPGYFMLFPGGLLPLVLPIPDSLKLWYGDNYLEARLRKLGYPVYGVDVWVDHAHGGSQNVNVLPNLQRIIEEDRLAWEDVSKQYGIAGRP